MNTLIIYDSTFGNTEQVAGAITKTLRKYGAVRIARADEVSSLELKEAALLIMGGPTQSHRISSAMASLLCFPHEALQGLKVAAFDTRYHIFV